MRRCYSPGPGLSCLFFVFLSLPTIGWSLKVDLQAVPKSSHSEVDFSSEAFVIEDNSTTVTFESDGSYRRQLLARVRIQSVAGVQRYSVLTFPYQSGAEILEIPYVRVRKSDGATVTTPNDSYQDMPTEITRKAPFYSDLREKQVAVKGLGVGDVLEFVGMWHTTKPLIPGQFWFSYNFDHESITLAEKLEITVPSKRPVTWRSAMKPNISEKSGSQVYTWTSSQLQHKSEEEEKKEKERAAYDGARGKNRPPDVQLSSFQNWEEVGRWYGSLQGDRVKLTPEIRSKAAEITRGLNEETAKIRAIYDFVSTQFRYIGVAFGIGRFQPHFAEEVLSNQYGDCKDKHTLLAAMLEAIGVKAYPALISSFHDIDIGVPSPAQFDHVITAVAEGDHFRWLDSTPELAPAGYLIGPLRDKQALVIAGGKPVLVNTPAVGPTQGTQDFRIDAKLSETGTLEGTVERTFQGDDNALLLRAAFRSVPLPQWKDLTQEISKAAGFAGEVSDATASSPEKTDEPFRIQYKYTRKDFGDWPNRRIVAPLPFLALPQVEEKTGKPSCPIWLGPPIAIHAESRVELPKGYKPEIPIGVDVKEEFAEYHASHRMKDGVLISERQLIVKAREVPLAEIDSYIKFSKTVADDYGMFIALSSGDSPKVSFQQAMLNLPMSRNADAAAAFARAAEQFQNRDMQQGVAALERAVHIDPKFSRAWIALAQVYAATGRNDQALTAYGKAKEADPGQPVLYKALGFALHAARRFDEAVPVWQELIKIAPSDIDGFANLGSALLALKRYKEAVAAFESAVTLKPDAPGMEVRLGSAYLRLGDDQRALKAYGRALEIDDSPSLLNDISYELADANKDLPEALQYAEKAVLKEEEASQDADADELEMEDLQHPGTLAAYWDTLGWVHFRLNNFNRAEKYLDAAWKLGQSAVMAEHLGEVYDRKNKKPAAVRMYKIALQLYKSLPSRDDAEIRKVEARLERITPGKSVTERYNFSETSEEINRTRTIKLPRSLANDATAQFFLVFERDPQTSAARVQGVKFISGSDELKRADNVLSSAKFDASFPDDGPTRLVRRGILSCYKAAGCSFTLINPGDVRSLD